MVLLRGSISLCSTSRGGSTLVAACSGFIGGTGLCRGIGPHHRGQRSHHLAAGCGGSLAGFKGSPPRSSGYGRRPTGAGAGIAFATAAGPAYSTPRAPRLGPRVCILGGGFGGLYTAVKLEQLLWPRDKRPQVTLIDQSERFVFKPLLYDLVAGVVQAWQVAPHFTQVLAPYNINFVQGSVAAVEPELLTRDGGSAGGGRVVLSGGDIVEYDWLVLALGAETSTFGIPGVRELALPFCTYDDAVQVLQRLEAIEATVPNPEVVVVGAGYAGIELAATVAERLKGRGRIKVLTFGQDILEGAPAGQVKASRTALQEKGVSIVTNARVTNVKRAGLEPAAGQPDIGRRLVYLQTAESDHDLIEADLILWTAGSRPVSKPEGAEQPEAGPSRKLVLPFPRNSRGATQTDATLRVPQHTRVFALGDVSGPGVPADRSFPATAQVAFQQADYVAWNLWSAVNGRPLLPFKYQHLGDMMSLGRVNGAVTLPLPLPPPLSSALGSGPLADVLGAAGVKVGTNDGSQGITLEGPLAGALRRAAYWYRQPTNEHRIRVGASWLEQAGKDASAAAANMMSGKPPFSSS